MGSLGDMGIFLIYRWSGLVFFEDDVFGSESF